MASKNNSKVENFEKTLFKAADKLRKNMDAAEYKHIVLGLIFLKYISDSFEALHQKLIEGKGEYKGADPEDADEYRAENVFFVPPTARWSYLHSRAKLPSIGKDIDDAMTAIEKENQTLKGILPKVFARPNLDKTSLGGLIDLVGNIALGDEAAKAKDILGRVYEYFLGEFANAEGKKGGQFYTPKSIVGLMVGMIEPYKGRVFDPCCGSGGMFIMSEKFIESHQGRMNDIAIYGQESNQTTYRLCRMNLAIRQIDGSQVKWNNEGSFLNDTHKDLKADFILANPPFNDSDWSGELLQKDARWKYGVPPAANANYAWLQHMIYHLSPKGILACVLADSSMTVTNGNEAAIKKNLLDARLVDCMISLPSHLFTNTQITACIWFIARNKSNSKFRKRENEILFIDASTMGVMLKRKKRALSNEDVMRIAGTYHSWRNPGGDYRNVPGFCRSVIIDEVKANDYVLAPNRYISPICQEVELGIDLNNPLESEKLGTTRIRLAEKIGMVEKAWATSEIIKIKDVYDVMDIAEELGAFCRNLYNGLIKNYFIDYLMSSSTRTIRAYAEGEVPNGWQKKAFGDLFEERNTSVKEEGYCPLIYSVTNSGIQLREGKYSKELSKYPTSMFSQTRLEHSVQPTLYIVREMFALA